ncbi:MAG TPA: FAD-dependent oxidoreductase [Trebonia sp.]|jgi:3-phenylpropionate/trans-cinnamate dioxygenase ferredoxin reductase subunit
MATFVIVGGGLAGAKAAETLRSEGFDGEVVLFGSEPERPYERPPLAKGYLLGKNERESVFVHSADWYAEHNVDLRTGVTVAMVDPAAHLVTFDGGTVAYDKLLLATGASARRIDIPGAGLGNVLYLRTLEESEALRAAFTPDTRVVIVGAGWIGLEAAAAARTAGSSVTVLEPQPSALYGVLGPELGGKFADLHRAHGVEFRFGESAAEFLAAAGSGQVGSVATTAGVTLPADVVVVGIGAVPNDELAVSAGLEVDHGVVTDSALRTSDPDIFAAGDVASSYLPLLGRHLRMDHWSNALNGGKAAAQSMLGQQVEYNRVPYFYSDQYDLGMECSGLPLPGTYDQVVYRGDSDTLEFIAFWLADGHLIAGMNVNVWDVSDDIQSLIRSAKPLDPARLADPTIPLSEV